jgi:hypothetical protein
MGYPNEADRQRILTLYLDRFGVNDELTRRRLLQTLNRDLGRLHLVPAHIEEFVKAGIKRARLARRPPEYQDFEGGHRSYEINSHPQNFGCSERQHLRRGHHRSREAARHRRARPHHRRQGRPRQPEGVEADLTLLAPAQHERIEPPGDLQ